jgi:hypothetical protein
MSPVVAENRLLLPLLLTSKLLLSPLLERDKSMQTPGPKTRDRRAAPARHLPPSAAPLGNPGLIAALPAARCRHLPPKLSWWSY